MATLLGILADPVTTERPTSVTKTRRPKRRHGIFALAHVTDVEMGKTLTEVKTEKQRAIEREAAERLKAFIEHMANKD